MTHFMLSVNVERIKITDTGAIILSLRYEMPFIITSLPIQGKMEKMALPNLVLFMKKGAKQADNGRDYILHDKKYTCMLLNARLTKKYH
jgi:hypothetical protein